jgi:hypothetical protein
MSTHRHLDECVRESLEQYFRTCAAPSRRHARDDPAVEKPLLEVVMQQPKATRARPPNGWASTATPAAQAAGPQAHQVSLTTALLSVSDKTGVVDFARALAALGVGCCPPAAPRGCWPTPAWR